MTSIFTSTFTCTFLALLLQGCMDWDSSQPITCRNTPQEQQQWASALGLTAGVSLAGTGGEKDSAITLHPHHNMDVEELHLTPLEQSDALPQHLRLKPAWEVDWWLPMGDLPAPLSGRYRLELVGSTTKESSPRNAARCWRLTTDIDFSRHVGMVELKAPPA